ncbi:MAG: hypothetical protein HWD58_12815 [Bacteroidota bacterium]|nr:MAG: hypothetical protein HWD58_12815 [Bacteroidota bacterium]
MTNSSTLNLYSDNWNGTMQIGAFDLPGNPLFGWTKVGRIGEINNGTNVVTGAIYENGIYTNTNKLPCMFEIRYDDPSLINFQTGMQNSSINYYPRVLDQMPLFNIFKVSITPLNGIQTIAHILWMLLPANIFMVD